MLNNPVFANVPEVNDKPVPAEYGFKPVISAAVTAVLLVTRPNPSNATLTNDVPVEP